jgi:U6 snRNA-associated Sm-like protein LSm1
VRFAANIVLEDAFERHFAAGKFADIPMGVYVVRGENVVMMGQLVSLAVWREGPHPHMIACAAGR